MLVACEGPLGPKRDVHLTLWGRDWNTTAEARASYMYITPLHLRHDYLAALCLRSYACLTITTYFLEKGCTNFYGKIPGEKLAHASTPVVK